MKIALFFGTETGNTEMLADDVFAHLKKAHTVTLANLADTIPADLNGHDLVVIFSSSYGEGEPPLSAKPFVDKIAAEKPDLTGVQIAVFGMGDKATYPETFGGGSAQLAHRLVDLGAKQRGEHLVHDIGSIDFAEEIAIEWIDEIIGSMA